MDALKAKDTLKKMLPAMVDNYRSKEITYMDYRDNTGDTFGLRERLYNEFDGYRHLHNNFVKELDELKSIIKDDDYVSNLINKYNKKG